MKSKTSKTSIVLRSFLLLPLIGILLAGFTETKLIEVAPEEATHIAEISSSSENIQILINTKGQLRIDNRLVALENFDSFLLERNEGLLEEERIKTMRAQIIVEKKSPAEVIADVERILNKYGVAQIDIWGPETIPPPAQKGATKEQLSKYNSLAKKYNAVPQTDRVILMEDLKTLEQVFRKMTDTQKKDALPFPECPQDGATTEQLAEYNALAKKYNDMMQQDNIRIRKSDVDRLEYLHGLMSEEQRENAEPYPDFPEPPEPPMPPNSSDEEEIIEMEREMVRQERAMKEQEGAMIEQELSMKEKELAMRELERTMTQKEHAMKEQEVEMERQERIMEKQEVKMREQADFPASPNLAYRVDQKPLSKELKKLVDNYAKKRKSYQNAVKDYLNHGKGNKDKIHSIYANLLEAYGKYKIMANDEGVFAYPSPAFAPKVKKGDASNIPPPPTIVNVPVTPEQATDRLREDLKNKNSSGELTEVPESPKRLSRTPSQPPAPKSPLDHVIEMAKKDATFYFEGKKISSDKAIEIIKNNNEINIHSTGSKSKRPEVKLTTAPIVID